MTTFSLATPTVLELVGSLCSASWVLVPQTGTTLSS